MLLKVKDRINNHSSGFTMKEVKNPTHKAGFSLEGNCSW